MFEREDWSLFRTVEGLQQRAGVPKDQLTRLVMKELADNGLDAGATEVSVGELPKGYYFVEDDGPGISGTPEDIARLFSINRPMVSSKLLRLPTRGALGNGLRVVASAVLVSEGSLTVSTRNRRIVLRPERDGTTTVVDVKAIKFPVGTRIEIRFGPALPCNEDTLGWARLACRLARTGATYSGKSSPHWYDVPQFHELLYASGDTPVRELIAQLDGCADKADTIAARAGLNRVSCKEIDKKQAARLLAVAQKCAEQVDLARLGGVGPKLFSDKEAYACTRGFVAGGARIPFVVEVWAGAILDDDGGGDTSLCACVNRTPVTGAIDAARDKRDIDVFGCGLHHTIAKAPAETQFTILLNITTPFMPITSDGKAPDLLPFLFEIRNATGKAVQKARRPTVEPDTAGLLPKRKKGRQSPEADRIYRRQVERFCALIRQIYSTLDFGVGSRDYCYLLEEHGLAKGDFDTAQKQITACRKSGDLPLNICAEDASRETIGIEQIDSVTDIDAKVAAMVDQLRNHAHEQYLPIGFWDDLDVYVEIATEKLSLRNLFEPVCKEFHVPITNLKGWSDFNSRAAMMQRFKMHEAQGRLCVLLLCGDHDPGGLLITKKMRKNLADLAGAVGWTPTEANLPRLRRHQSHVALRESTRSPRL